MTGMPAASSCSMRRSRCRPSPATSVLDGVQAKTAACPMPRSSACSKAAPSSRLQIAGAGANAEEIKSSLHGQGSIAVSDGAIEGINLTEMISQIGAGEIPEMRQGPGAKTAFTDLGGSFTIKNGIAETEQSPDDQPAAQSGGGGHRGPDAKHDQHAGQSRDRRRGRRAGRRQRSCRAFGAGPHRGPARPSHHQARAQGHVRQSREGRQDGATRSAMRCRRSSRANRSARRSAASSAMSRSGPRAATATARPSPKATASARKKDRSRLPRPKRMTASRATATSRVRRSRAR